MKRILLLLALASAAAFGAADYVQGERSTDLVTPELRAMAETLFGAAQATQILHAVELTMTKYDRDMQTHSGRLAWHGRLHHEEVDTNALVKVMIYTNATTGATWRYEQPFATKTAAKVKVISPVTNGIPVALAQARLRREVETTTVSNVTVTVEAN